MLNACGARSVEHGGALEDAKAFLFAVEMVAAALQDTVPPLMCFIHCKYSNTAFPESFGDYIPEITC
jgi:hypothetical protein